MPSGRFILTICVIFAANFGEIRTNLIRKLQTSNQGLANIRDELTDDYGSLISDIMDLHFKDSKFIFVEMSKRCVSCEKIMALLMRECKFSFLGVEETNSHEISYERNVFGKAFYKFVIFLVNDVQEFNERFNETRQSIKWNPRARHLIVFSKPPAREQIEMVFKSCWKYKMLNVGITIVNRAETYTYNPFLRDDFYEEISFARLYYDKLQNMNGHVISSRYIPSIGKNIPLWLPEEKRYKHFGADFGFATFFFQAVNATPFYQELTNELMPLFENISYCAKFYEVLAFEGFELWFNSMITGMTFQQRTEISYPLGRQDLSVMVPKSGLETPSIFQPYDNITWACIFVTLMIFSFYTYIFYQRRGIKDNAFIRTWGIFLGKEMANRDLEVLEKFVLLLLTTAALLITSAYQGSLYGALATIKHGPDINTLEELFRMTKHIHVYVNNAADLKDNLPEGVQMHTFVYQDDRQLLKLRHSAYVYPKFFAYYTAEHRELFENGMPLFHVMREYIVPIFIHFHVPYGSPYLDKLDEVCRSALEAGLDQFWDKEADVQSMLTGKTIHYVRDKTLPEKMSLKVQLVSFYILAGGLLISTLCFAAERRIAKRNPLLSSSDQLRSR